MKDMSYNLTHSRFEITYSCDCDLFSLFSSFSVNHALKSCLLPGYLFILSVPFTPNLSFKRLLVRSAAANDISPCSSDKLLIHCVFLRQNNALNIGMIGLTWRNFFSSYSSRPTACYQSKRSLYLLLHRSIGPVSAVYIIAILLTSTFSGHPFVDYSQAGSYTSI